MAMREKMVKDSAQFQFRCHKAKRHQISDSLEDAMIVDKPRVIEAISNSNPSNRDYNHDDLLLHHNPPHRRPCGGN